LGIDTLVANILVVSAVEWRDWICWEWRRCFTESCDKWTVKAVKCEPIQQWFWCRWRWLATVGNSRNSQVVRGWKWSTSATFSS